MIKIYPVTTKKQRKQFVQLPLDMYKNCEQFVPPLYGDELKLFTDKNGYAQTCQSSFFLAEKDGKIVGRIQGIIQNQRNELFNEKRVRFTRFDSINDQEVANALFNAVEQWGANLGMEICCGPLGYSDLEREGLLIEGFDQLSTFEEQYNYAYYQTLIENYGYAKEVDWVEYKIFAPDVKNDKLARIGQRSLAINKLHVVDSSKMSKRAYINRYKDGFFNVLDVSYNELYGTVPISEESKKSLIEQFMLIINKKYLVFICDENDRVVAFSLCFPSISKALQKSGGRLTPACIMRLFKDVNSPKILDLALVGILPEYRSTGLNATVLAMLADALSNGEVEYCESNLELEYNTAVQAQWKHFRSELHKRRRAYMKAIALKA